VILASDAVYCADNFAPDFRRAGYLADVAGADRTVRTIAALASRLGAQIWFGHDVAQFRTLRLSTEGWYE
jgi:N-acyl homoserine lactone hydrolase